MSNSSLFWSSSRIRSWGPLVLVWGLAGCPGTPNGEESTEGGASSSEAGESTAAQSTSGETSSDDDEMVTTSSSTSGTSSSTSSSTSSESTTDPGTSSTSSTGTTSTSGEGSDGSDTGSSESGGTPGEFVLSSTAFEGVDGCGPAEGESDLCDLFSSAHVSGLIQGDNLSPPLAWTDPPAGTASFALVFHDLSNGFAHWAMWNIPADLRELPEGLPGGAMPPGFGPETRQVDAQFAGDANNEAFFGSGRAGNVYEFALYALDTDVFTPADASGPDAVQDEIEASAALLGSARLRARSNPAQ